MPTDVNPFRVDELVDPPTTPDSKSQLRIWAAFGAALLSMIVCGLVNSVVSLPIAISASAMFQEQLGFGQLGLLLFMFVPLGCLVGVLSLCLLFRNSRGLIVFGLITCAVPFVVPSFRAVIGSLWSLFFTSIVLVLIDFCLSVILWKVLMSNSRGPRP